MGRDLADILEAAAPRQGPPQLVEVSRALTRGRVATTGYFWSSGRISATVGTHGVHVRRRSGVTSPGLELEAATIQRLALACREWSRRREEWAAFYDSGSGYPPGYGGGACYYQAPGRGGDRITVGRRGCLGHGQEGADLVGTEEVVAVAPQRRQRAVVVGELWRRGERQGPEAGSLVGLRYELGAGVYFDARRRGARVWHERGGNVDFEPGEEAFVAALLEVLPKPRRARGLVRRT